MTISFSGLLTGLDTSSWVEALTSLKRAKVTTLQQKQNTITTQRDAFQNIKSYFNSFRTTLEKITDANLGISSMDLFSQKLATSSDNSKLTASANTNAEEKNYTVKIDKIATNTQASSNFNSPEGNISASVWADNDTLLSSLNISQGSFSIFRDGMRASVYIERDETFRGLQDKINTEFRNRNGEEYADINFSFEKGHLKISSSSDVKIISGSSTDTSNLASFLDTNSSETNFVLSARELYKVNTSSRLTESGLFRRGNITEGDFVIGDQTITIGSNTTLNDIILEINSYNDSVSASWDNTLGQLTFQSLNSGSMFINIEAGSSNFTDILGFTSSIRDENNNIVKTSINANAQKTGKNAVFYVNNNLYTSNSNTVGEDITGITGVTFNLKNATEGDIVTLNIQQDTDNLSDAVEDVVESYNNLMAEVDNTISSTGELSKQTTLKLLRNQIKNYMTGSLSNSSVFRNLDAIGISVGTPGSGNISLDSNTITKLSFDRDKFQNAYYTNENALRFLLIGNGTNSGIFSSIKNTIEGSLQSVNGYFDSQTASYNNQIKQLSEQMTRVNKQVKSYQSVLENKFSNMDMLISNMQQNFNSFLNPSSSSSAS